MNPHSDELDHTSYNDVEAKPHREPIFNRLPLGVVIVSGLILGVYLILMFVSPQRLREIQFDFGVVPVRDWVGIGLETLPASLKPLVTSQFLHGGLLHLVMNLAMLLQAGPICEAGFARHRYGAARFVVFFLVCGICGGLAYCVLNSGSNVPTIGASGAISGVFGGFLWAAIGLARPGEHMLKPVLSSAAVFLLINVGLAWIGRASGFVPIAWEAHLGGFVAGLILFPVIARLGPGRP
jgi:membrane associated rhomboid family serine protease